MTAIDRGRWRRLAYGDIGSTNDEALRLAGEGEAGDLWITARRQLAGRGRRGRAWVSEPGNLYATLLMIAPAPAANLGQLPFVAALGVHRAVAALLPGADAGRLTVKWPNDLLYDGAKIAGILIESGETGFGKSAVAIGCGVNCAHCPGDDAAGATSLARAGHDIGPEDVFAALTEAFGNVLDLWRQGEGFAAVRRAWLDVASGIGGPIVVRLADRTLKGVFEGLDEAGRLNLRQADGTRQTIAAGDVFLLPGCAAEAGS